MERPRGLSPRADGRVGTSPPTSAGDEQRRPVAGRLRRSAPRADGAMSTVVVAACIPQWGSRPGGIRACQACFRPRRRRRCWQHPCQMRRPSCRQQQWPCQPGCRPSGDGRLDRGEAPVVGRDRAGTGRDSVGSAGDGRSGQPGGEASAVAAGRASQVAAVAAGREAWPRLNGLCRCGREDFSRGWMERPQSWPQVRRPWS